MLFADAEKYKDRIPPRVFAEAEKLVSGLLKRSAGQNEDVKLVDGWTLRPYGIEYRCTYYEAADCLNLALEHAAYDVLEERLEDLLDEKPELYGSTFMLDDPKEHGATVLITAPEKWWTVRALQDLSGQYRLQDYTSGNDSCPSLGAELKDGYTVQIFVGHPHPDHHTRDDGCDPRFAIYEYRDDDENPPGDVVWSGESEKEAADQVRRIIKKHGGVRRQLYKT